MPKIIIKGKEVEGDSISFSPVKEEWNEYKVGDHIIRIKLVVSDILKDKVKVDAQGNPVFYIHSGNVIAVQKVNKGIQ